MLKVKTWQVLTSKVGNAGFIDVEELQNEGRGAAEAGLWND